MDSFKVAFVVISLALTLQFVTPVEQKTITLNLANRVLYSYKTNQTEHQIKSTRIYSSQLGNNKIINRFFSVSQNKKDIFLSDTFQSRVSLCSSLKNCDSDLSSIHKCVMSMNVIFYSSSFEPQQRQIQTSTRYINKIKSVKLNLVLSDFTSDFLRFAQDFYTYKLTSKSLVATNDDFVSLGFISAFMTVNSEFNANIKYYLDFKSENKAEFIDLFEINSDTGLLKLNKKRFLSESNNFNRKFEFYVDAQSQCATEDPLRNRTTITITVLNQNQTQFQVTNLIDVKRLSSTFECVKLTRKELVSNKMIALAQVIINENTKPIVPFELVHMKPSENQLNVSNFRIQHLIDNIYVIYLQNTITYNGIFMNDIYNVQFKFGDGSSSASAVLVHLCIDATLRNNRHDDLSLVQFKKNIIYLNEPVAVEDLPVSNESSVDLVAYSLDTPKLLKFQLNDEQMNIAPFEFKLFPAGLDMVKLKYKKLALFENEIEQLQYSIDSIAYDSALDNPAQAFEELVQLAVSHGKFLRSMCKILINKNIETFVNDFSATQSGQTFDFFIKPDNLVSNSVLGYLPNIHDLKLSQSLTFKTAFSPAHSFYYELDNATNYTECFRLNKFDGVLTLLEFSDANCTSQQLVQLNVNLRSMLDETVLLHYTTINLHSLDQERIQPEEVNFYEANANAANLVYESLAAKDLDNKAERNQFGLNFFLNKTKDSAMPEHIRLVNLVSNFQPNLAKFAAEYRPVGIVMKKIDYKTEFELIEPAPTTTFKPLFVMDTKKNAIYVNIQADVEFKCYKLNLVAKNFIYLNSIKRKLVSSDAFVMNLCFLNKDSYDIELERLNPINGTITYRSFIEPVYIDNEISFQQLSAKDVQNKIINISVFISCFALLTLILVVSFLVKKSKRVDQKQIEDKNLEANLSTVYSVSIIRESFNNLSTSLETTSTKSSELDMHEPELRIRNDQSFDKMINQSFGTNTDHFQDMERIYTSITHGENSSEDQGVYCLATGESFSLTSNISSVTSQFVDTEENELRNLNTSDTVEYSLPKKNLQNATKLSLFDLTPQPVKQAAVVQQQRSYPLMNIDNYGSEYIYAVPASVDISVARSKNSRLSNEMQNYIYSNYISNCVEMKREKISLSDENDSIDSLEFIRSQECSQECII